MSWRVAKSLEKLRDQVNAAVPSRDKSSDGTIGDAAHAARVSDHNPDDEGVVRALDITHDPAHGVDSEKLAETLRQSRDPRIKYIISNRKIVYSTGAQPWAWQAYDGQNPHDKHCHISVVKDNARADDMSSWNIAAAFAAAVLLPDQPGVNRNIVATFFGGPSDAMSGAETAYGSMIAPGWWDRPGVALPARINDRPLPWVRVTHNGKSVICPVIDVGPWNTKDPYWLTAARPQAESGVDMTGRKTNLAGIDLTPAAASAIGLPGKGLVDWEFVKENGMPDQPADDTVLKEIQGMRADLAQLTASLGAMVAALNDAIGARPPVTPPKPVDPPPPPPPPPPIAPPSTGSGLKQTGILGLLLSAFLQWNGSIDVTQSGSFGQLLPIFSAGLGALGMTGGGLGGLSGILSTGLEWLSKQTKPKAT